MFVIESTNAKQWRWLSAVVRTYEEAHAQLQAIPESLRAFHRVVEHPGLDFPVFMVEAQGFELGSLDFIRARLRQLVPCGDDEHVHMNVYAIKDPFVPGRPGRDDMGRLLHWHITDLELGPPGSEVLDAEWAEIANGD